MVLEQWLTATAQYARKRKSKMEKSNSRWIDIKVAKQILLGTIATIASSSLELGGGVSTLRVSGT